MSFLKLPYSQAADLYDLFVAKPSFTRSRSLPLRKELTLKERRRYMKEVYGSGIAIAKTVGRGMFPEISSDLVEKQENVKREFETLRARSRSLRGKLHGEWNKKDVLKLACESGADLSALTRYFGPSF